MDRITSNVPSVFSSVDSIPSIGVLSALPLVFFLYWVAWIIYARTLHPLSKIPGPFLASISRLWVIWRVHRGDMEHAQLDLHQKYGLLIRISPHELACADLEAIKSLYPTQSPLSKTDFYPPWGAKIFSKYPDHFCVTDEKLHTERRRIVNHVYSLSNVLQSEEYIDECSLLFIQRIGEYADLGQVLDLGEWLQWYAFDTVGELFFGKMFGFMANREDHKSWIAHMDTLLPVLCIVAVAPSYTRSMILMSSVLNPVVRKALAAIDHIASAARTCVAERVNIDIGEIKGESRRDLMQQFLDIKREKGEKVDFGTGEIHAEAYTALFAGSDTTAIAMRSVFYHLLKNPKIYAQLQQEIDTATTQGSLSSPPKYSEAIQLPLLCASVKEGMRLHPSVGLTMPRLVPKGGMILCDQYIPEGYSVGMNGAVVHYDKRVFGPDADQFRPQRWLERDAKMMDKYMLHFGAGTRTCIGKNISISEIHKLIPFILQRYALKLKDPKQEWTTNNKWFNKQTGLEVLVKHRD